MKILWFYRLYELKEKKKDYLVKILILFKIQIVIKLKFVQNISELINKFI